MRRLAPHLPRPLRPVLGRADRIRPLLTRALTLAGPEAAAMARTTFAVTTLRERRPRHRGDLRPGQGRARVAGGTNPKSFSELLTGGGPNPQRPGLARPHE